MEIYACDWIKNKKYVRIDLNFTLSLPLTPTIPPPYPTDQSWSCTVFLVVYTMLFPRANIGRWRKGRGENIAIFLTLISTSHVEQLCSSLSQTNYSMIVALTKKV